MRIGINSIEDWGIVTGFRIGSPPVKEKTYNIPGRHGKLDASNALTGYVIYDDRPISIDMFIKRNTAEAYQATYEEIYKACHGKILKLTLPFDNEYYYEGRWKVSATQESLSHGKVTLSAECYPYALKKEVTTIDISSTTGAKREVKLSNAGMPTKLHIESDADITLKRGMKTAVYNGTTIIHEPLLIEEEIITVSGTGNARIYYQEGKI